MKPIADRRFKEAKITIRNLNGNDTLFIDDGTGDENLVLIPNQSTQGHIWYIDGNTRYKTFRATLLIDGLKVDQGSTIKSDGQT